MIKFFSLSFTNRCLFVRIYILSGLVRLMVLLIPFRYFKTYLGEYKKQTDYTLSKSSQEIVYQIQYMIDLVCSNTPWKSECLVRAITAQKFITRRNLSSTLYLGVRKNHKEKLNAHAWLRCGSIIVTGEHEKDLFQEIARFGKHIIK